LNYRHTQNNAFERVSLVQCIAEAFFWERELFADEISLCMHGALLVKGAVIVEN
jgi:hypothetical protein